MGTAQAQGEAWGQRAADWGSLQEPTWRPVYAAMMDHAGIGPGTRLLDIGCGAGGALLVARQAGAEVAGLDASAAMVEEARRRLPGARVEIGEMEELPFADASFDAVTAFNALQFAANPVKVLRDARRVVRPAGVVAVLVWGRREDCDLISVTMPAVMNLLPPPPPSPAAPSPVVFAEPGGIEGLMGQAELSPRDAGDLDGDFAYPDAETAFRAIASSPPMVRAIKTIGEDAVQRALIGSLGRFTRTDGSIVQHNRFRWVTARRA
jgi:SAM-dependent methyltransferase